MSDENIPWLLQEGGPAIRHRACVELIGDATSLEGRVQAAA